MNQIKCAVIGVGYLGRFHAEKYTKTPNVKLIAVCDSDQKRSQETAKSYKVTPYTDYRQLLGKVDAVSIATATTQHYEIAKAFLMHKTHVLLEKPMTTTVAEAEDLVALARKNQVILQIGHLERFNPAFIALAREIQNPSLVIASRLAPYKPRGNDVSVVLDLMIHDIDLVHHLISHKINKLYGKTIAVISKTPDFAMAEITYKNGGIARLTASRLSPYAERTLTVIQKNAYFYCDLQNKTLTINRQDPQSSTPATTAQQLTFGQSDALYDEIQAFITAITNHSLPIVSGEDGVQALATALAI